MILTRKRFKKVIQELKEAYILPGIKAEVAQVLKQELLLDLQTQLGYCKSGLFDWISVRPGNGLIKPRFSVSERVDAIAAHLGLVFDKTDATPSKVILRKPKKRDRPVVYRKKSLKAGGDK